MKKAFYEEYLEELARQDSLGSTGSNGKNAEVLVRDAFMVNGIRNHKDVRARQAEKVDFSFKYEGKLYRGESKTGQGALLYGNFTKADLDNVTEDDIYPDMDIIVYGIEGAMINEKTFKKVMVVFTREQFVEMLVYTGKKGLRSSIQIGKSGKQIQIQAWKTKECEKRYNKFWDYVEANNIPSLEDVLRQIGRG